MSRKPSGSGSVRATPSPTLATTVLVVPRSMPTTNVTGPRYLSPGVVRTSGRPGGMIRCDQDGSSFPRSLPVLRPLPPDPSRVSRVGEWHAPCSYLHAPPPTLTRAPARHQDAKDF